MNWQKMNKEQKQKIILMALMGLFVVAAIYRFGIVPIFDRHENNVQKINDLRMKIDRAQMAFRGEVQVDKEAKSVRAGLEHVFSTDVPPSDNALSWASQIIYAQTRQLGLEVVSIVEAENVGGWDSPDLAKRSFKPYSVRVELACSFEKARNLVRSLQQSNEHLAISSLSITADSRNVEKPSVMLVIEWPIWRDAKKGQHPFDAPVLPREKRELK
jgi:hypothetical protein